MSYASVLQQSSNGSLGAFKTTGAFAPVALVSGVPSVVSNRLALELGLWMLQVRVSFATNADDTTEITDVLVTLLNEVGNLSQNTIIWNGSTAGAYLSQTQIYNYMAFADAEAVGLNEFLAEITWTGAGSAPSASIILNAYKVV
jgi:hypothetical protein